MKNAFESLLEKKLPELNILSVSGADIKPGSVLESLEKDIVIGYLPKYLTNTTIDINKLEVEEVPYAINLEKLSGISSENGALNIMKTLGLTFNSSKNYSIDLEIKGITSYRFANEINKIDFEIALDEFAKQNKKIYKKFKNHFFVTRVVFADEFKITVHVEKNGEFKADLKLNEINFDGNATVKKEENAILVSNNKEVPFAVVCFKIKKGKLKEKD